MKMTGRRNVADKRRASPMSVLLRRLYLAASELHPGVLAALLAAHMAASYAALRLAGEPELRALVAFIY